MYSTHAHKMKSYIYYYSTHIATYKGIIIIGYLLGVSYLLQHQHLYLYIIFIYIHAYAQMHISMLCNIS